MREAEQNHVLSFGHVVFHIKHVSKYNERQENYDLIRGLVELNLRRGSLDVHLKSHLY